MSIAIVTGASSGLGKLFVTEMKNYFDVEEIVVIARRVDRLENLKEEVPGVKITPLALDLGKDESLLKLKEYLEENKPSIKVVVNAAGFGKFEEFLEGDLQIHNQMVDLNCKALQAITFLVAPYMEENGRIVEIASMASIQPVPYLCLYGATKAFVLSFARALNKELRHKNVRVIALTPYWVKTEFFDVAHKENKELINYFNKMYTADFIVEKCYKHIIKKHPKDVCTPGKFARAQYRLVKVLPHRMVLNMWLRQQKLK